MSTKFIDNKYIEQYANGNPQTRKCLMLISDIIAKEAKAMSDFFNEYFKQ